MLCICGHIDRESVMVLRRERADKPERCWRVGRPASVTPSPSVPLPQLQGVRTLAAPPLGRQRAGLALTPPRTEV